MDEVGDDVVEQALVVGDEHDAELVAAHGFDAFGDDLEGVDIEAGVGLVHEGEGGLEHGHLEDLAAFLFAAGEALVDRAGGELPVDLEHVHLGVEALVVGGGVELLALGEAGLDGGAEEVGDGDAGDFGGVLEGEEDAGAGAFVGLHFEDGFAFDEDLAGGDDVVGVAGDGLGEGGFAGAVGPHDGVNLAGFDRQVEAFDDGLVGGRGEGDVQIADFEGGHEEKGSEGVSERE